MGESKQVDDARETPPSVGGAKSPAMQGRSRTVFVVAAIVAVVAILLGGSYITAKGSRLFGGRGSSTASETQVKSGDPNVLAAPGQKLLRIVTPPSQTRTEIKLAKDLGNPVFRVEFHPYGLASNGTVVIRVTKVSAQGGNRLAAPFAQALAGQNLQASVALDSRAVLKTGGLYSGNVTLVDDSGADSFAVGGVKQIK